MNRVLPMVSWLMAALLWLVPPAFAPAAFARTALPSTAFSSTDLPSSSFAKATSTASSATTGAPSPVAVAVVEHLRIKVPANALSVWHRAEEGSWEPWLAKQDGFLGRDLLWDPETEEGTLLIRWASREQWKAIPAAEVAQVQDQFERIARDGMGQTSGNPFPLVFEGELLPQ